MTHLFHKEIMKTVFCCFSGEFNKRSQNSLKNNKTFWSVNYKKNWSSIGSKFCLLVALNQYLLNTNDICF